MSGHGMAHLRFTALSSHKGQGRGRKGKSVMTLFSGPWCMIMGKWDPALIWGGSRSRCVIPGENNIFVLGGSKPSHYSGPSSYDRLDIRTTWVTTKILVLTLRPMSWVTTRLPVKATWVTTRMAFVSFILSPDTRVCGRNSGQCIALYH
jgi:hypothetical protein